MTSLPAKHWKHTTATSAIGDRVGIDLFDDDEPGFTSVYVRFKDGSLWPARTVDMTDTARAKKILDAWIETSQGGTNVNDHRKIKEVTS